MQEPRKNINVTVAIWERLRKLSHDNYKSMPKFLDELMDKWENKKEQK